MTACAKAIFFNTPWTPFVYSKAHIEYLLLLYEYRDLFIDMVVRNNRSELAIDNRHQER